jgi:hypothetical protein
MSPKPLDQVAEQAAEVDRLLATLERQIRQDYAPPRVKRDAHPKMHGCALAELRVDDDVPADLRHGVFAHRGRTFEAWVRFSNAFHIQHDIEFETRGLGLKLLGVPGDRLENAVPDDELETQDFLFATHDAFFLPNVDEYAEFAQATAGGPMAIGQFFLRRPRLWRGFGAMLRSSLVLAPSPLAIPYFSQTPYRLGPNQAVKLQARPLWTPELRAALPPRPLFWIKAVAGNVTLFLRELHGSKEKAEDFCDRYIAARDLLRHAMMSFLATHDARFEVLVQTHDDSPAMPIDDPTVSWGEHVSPFRRVAAIRVPRQLFWPEPGMPTPVMEATSDMVDLGENMSFNPWHSLKDHEPLGGINQARRRVYRAIVDSRRGLNGVTPEPPSQEYRRLRPLVQR